MKLLTQKPRIDFQKKIQVELTVLELASLFSGYMANLNEDRFEAFKKYFNGGTLGQYESLLAPSNLQKDCISILKQFIPEA